MSQLWKNEKLLKSTDLESLYKLFELNRDIDDYLHTQICCKRADKSKYYNIFNSIRNVCDKHILSFMRYCDDCNLVLNNGNSLLGIYHIGKVKDLCHRCHSKYYNCYDCHTTYKRRSANKFAEALFCTKCFNRLEHQLMIPVQSNIARYGTGNYKNIDRHIGIEAEMMTEYRYDDTCYPYRERYEHNFSEDFFTQEDGSLDEYGVELTSMPLKGERLSQAIMKIRDFKDENDGYINSSCGLHIHIDARDLYHNELRGIIVAYMSLEKWLLLAMPPSRPNNYTRLMSSSFSKYDFLNTNSNRELYDMWYRLARVSYYKDKYNPTRYYSLNIHSRIYRGTLEFRLHSGTTNYTKIMNWTRICSWIVSEGIKLGSIIKKLKTKTTNTEQALYRYKSMRLSPTWAKMIDNQSRKLLYGFTSVEDFVNFIGEQKDIGDLKEYIQKRIFKFDRSPSEYQIETRVDGEITDGMPF